MPTATVRLIATTDLHGALLPYDYERDCATKTAGLYGLIGAINAARRETNISILVDNGDFMQGTPMMDVIAPALPAGQMHPMISAMNQIGYDAVALGNHDFNFGLDLLARARRDLTCPSLCANVLDAKTGQPWATPWVILSRSVTLEHGTELPLKIGLIGLAPEQIPIWDSLTCQGEITADPIVETANRHVPDMRAAGADIVVALCHSGLGEEQDIPNIENAAIPLAAVDGIDALILGHTHLTFPDGTADAGPVDATRGTLHGKPAVMPKAFAGSLGCIDFTLVQVGNRWQVAAFDVFHRAPNGTTGGLIASPAIARAHEATLDHIRKPIGTVTAPLQSFFTRVGNCATLQIVHEAQKRLARHHLAHTPFADLPLLSAAAPFKAGGRGGAGYFIDIPAGPLAMRHIAELYTYPNLICIAPFSGAEIAMWLERSAGMFLQIAPNGGAQAMIDSNFPSYNFDVLDGLTYQFDLTQPSRFDVVGSVGNPRASRLRKLMYNRRPVDPTMQFVVVANSYRIGGGGAFFAHSPTRPVINPHVQARDAIADYINAASPLMPEPVQTWGFTPIMKASGLFQTAQRAAEAICAARTAKVTRFHSSDAGFIMGERAFD